MGIPLSVGVDIVLSSYAILEVMSKEVALRVIRTAGSVVAMVLIWRLVEAALAAGLDGVMFFAGVAAIAGLGGYELRWMVDAVRSKTSAKKNGG